MAIVISSFAPGAAATKYWNACECAEHAQPDAAELLAEPLLERPLRVDRDRPQVVGELDLLSGRRPRGANARDTRSCSATSQTIVRRPVRAAAEAERRGDGRLADAALAGHVKQPPVAQQCFHRVGARMTMDMDPALSEAYEACRRMQRRHDPTYYLATRRLPADVRPATHALYGYVRTADQIVDGPRRPATPEARRAALDAWEAELQRGPPAPAHPVVGALVDAAGGHGLPLGELGTYMRSMRVDCAPVRIDSWEELDAYMDGSAGSVGRIMAPLLGVPERSPRRLRPARPGLPAGELHPRRARGRELDRIYLPGTASASASDAGRLRDRRDARQVAAARARCSPPPAGDRRRARVRAARACGWRARRYLRMLDRVERVGFDVLGRRVGVRVRDCRRALEAVRVTRRATLRGDERTPLDERADVLICGASFAGLAVARELAGAGADVLVVDRYEIGERATSRLRGADAVAARDGRASARSARRSRAWRSTRRTGRRASGCRGAGRASTTASCARALWEQTDARFEIAKVRGRARRHGAHRPRRR